MAGSSGAAGSQRSRYPNSAPNRQGGMPSRDSRYAQRLSWSGANARDPPNCTEKPLRYGPLEARRTGVIWVRPLAWPPRLTGVRQVAEFSALPVCILQARRLCGRLTYAPTGILARGQAGRAVVPQGSRRSVVIHSGGKARPAETGSTAVASDAAVAADRKSVVQG